ncbi:MAG: hypothetical protein HYR95_01755 [Candidatus Colwellbacteria bacterium]|nr:hypothetical protein [Candidatus Colwellbacteria bacterium]
MAYMQLAIQEQQAGETHEAIGRLAQAAEMMDSLPRELKNEYLNPYPLIRELLVSHPKSWGEWISDPKYRELIAEEFGKMRDNEISASLWPISSIII